MPKAKRVSTSQRPSSPASASIPKAYRPPEEVQGVEDSSNRIDRYQGYGPPQPGGYPMPPQMQPQTQPYVNGNPAPVAQPQPPTQVPPQASFSTPAAQPTQPAYAPPQPTAPWQSAQPPAWVTGGK